MYGVDKLKKSKIKFQFTSLYRYEALDRTMWRTGFGRGYGPVVRQTAE
jgi:hypothetical protein